MFGKWLMKISEKMERKIYNKSEEKSEEKSPVDIEKKDLKNQEDLSTTESDSIKLGDYCNSCFLDPTDFSLVGSFDSLVNFLIYYDDDQ